MKILVVIGTPRRKNTIKIVQLFEDKIKHFLKQEVVFDYLFLVENQITICKGCFLCTKLGEEKCPQREEVLPIYQQMKEADGIILACPVYVDNVTALMKNFIDHFNFLTHRPIFFYKYALVISTTQGSGLKYVLDYLEKTIRKWGYDCVGKLGVKMPLYDGNEKYQKSIHDEIHDLSTRFINSIKTKKKISPTLEDLVFFRTMRILTTHIDDLSPKDKEFWSEIKTQDYFIDVKINPFKNLMAKYIEKKIRKAVLEQ